MSINTLKLIEVSGNFYECGFQIGKSCRDKIVNTLNHKKEIVQSTAFLGGNWNTLINHSVPYFEPTKLYCPSIVDAYLGCAKGAGVSFEDLWVYVIEDTLLENTNRCTDIVFDNHSNTGGFIVGHNNDIDLFADANIVLVKWNIRDFGKIITIGDCGIFVSVGANEFGINITGNFLVPNDLKTGVSTMAIATNMLMAKNMESALNMSIMPERASSYNNLVTSTEGCVSIEGSATDYALIYPANGFLVHTNHYLASKMLKYEGKDKQGVSYISSVHRYNSAVKQCVLHKNESPTGLTSGHMKRILTSHDQGKTRDSICRHSVDDKTVYSFIHDTTKDYIEVAKGNPCESVYEKIYF